MSNFENEADFKVLKSKEKNLVFRDKSPTYRNPQNPMSYSQSKTKSSQLWLPQTQNKNAGQFQQRIRGKSLMRKQKTINSYLQQKTSKSVVRSNQQTHQSLSVPIVREEEKKKISLKEESQKKKLQNDYNLLIQQDQLQGNINNVLVNYFNRRFQVQLNPARYSHMFFNKRKIPYVVNTTQGFIKKRNEDRVSVVVNISRKDGWFGEWPQISYFSIFDGHGGNWVSDYLKNNLHNHIIQNKNFPLEMKTAIQEGCEEAEKAIIEIAQSDQKYHQAGSCAVFVFFIDSKVYVGNVGDSRAVVSLQNGQQHQSLTQDHKPNKEEEKNRILKCGGEVKKSKYDQSKVINVDENTPMRLYPGGLSVSRAFGDYTIKDAKFGGKVGALISTPEIFEFDLHKQQWDFLFMGCDGIYDIFSTKDLVQKCWKYADHYKTIKKKSREIFYQNILNSILHSTMINGGYDNLTGILIPFSNGFQFFNLIFQQ